MARFETQVDPEGRLSPAERSRRAEHARKAHFKRLALKSAQARRKSREFSETAAAAERELAQAEHADLGLTDHQADQIGGEL